MLEIIRNFGRAFLICLCMGILFMVIFFEFQYDGQTGIGNVLGKEALKSSQQPVETTSSEEAYETYLSKKGETSEVMGGLVTNRVYSAGEIFGEKDKLLDGYISDVRLYETGEAKGDCIQSGGHKISFAAPGVYQLTVWLLDQNNIKNKRIFFVNVEEEEV